MRCVSIQKARQSRTLSPSQHPAARLQEPRLTTRAIQYPIMELSSRECSAEDDALPCPSPQAARANKRPASGQLEEPQATRLCSTQTSMSILTMASDSNISSSSPNALAIRLSDGGYENTQVGDGRRTARRCFFKLYSLRL